MKLDTSKKLSEVLQDVLRSDGTAKQMLEHRAEALCLLLNILYAVEIFIKC